MADQGTDHVDPVPLPDKEPGKHRWVTVAAFTVSDEQATLGMSSDDPQPVILGEENRVHLSIGCFDCGWSWDEVQDQPCKAEAGVMTGDFARPPVNDPSDFNMPEATPVGLGETDVEKAILLDSLGVTAVNAHGTEDSLRLLMSFVGRQNKTGTPTHHMFLLDPGMVGLVMAQMLFFSAPLGEAVQEAFDERIAELDRMMQEDVSAQDERSDDAGVLGSPGSDQVRSGADHEPGSAEGGDPSSGSGAPA